MEKKGYYNPYYERVFSQPEMTNALANYLRWCAKNNQNPECDPYQGTEEIGENGGTDILDHILYHSEIHQRKISKASVLNYCRDVVVGV